MRSGTDRGCCCNTVPLPCWESCWGLEATDEDDEAGGGGCCCCCCCDDVAVAGAIVEGALADEEEVEVDVAGVVVTPDT